MYNVQVDLSSVYLSNVGSISFMFDNNRINWLKTVRFEEHTYQGHSKAMSLL